MSNTGGLIFKKRLAAENSVLEFVKSEKRKEKRCRQGTHT